MANNQENTNNLANENTSSANNDTTEQVHYSIGRIVFVIIFLFFAILGTNVKPYIGCINKHCVNINVKFLLTNKFSVDIRK